MSDGEVHDTSGGSRGRITRVLQRVADGEPEAHDELMRLVYDELRVQARRLVGQRVSPLLQPTELMNETYLRLFGGEPDAWENRRHFYFAAARAMRDTLVEQIRREAAQKRGGGRQRVDLESGMMRVDDSGCEVLEVDRLLEALRAHDERCADVVFLRIFGGLTHAQAAQALGVSEHIVRREWAYGRAWLRRHAESGGDPGAG